MLIKSLNENQVLSLAQKVGCLLSGGEVIELVGDVGAGKTTFARGLARGLGITDDIQSPTFTISRIYPFGIGKSLAHYDFYRLQDAGILSAELDETLTDEQTITVIEWGEIVAGILPKNRITFTISASSEDERNVQVIGVGEHEAAIVGQLV